MPHWTDFALASPIAAGWVAALLGRFPSNRLGAHLALVAVYLLAYLLTIGVAIWGLRVLASWLGRRGHALGGRTLLPMMLLLSCPVVLGLAAVRGILPMEAQASPGPAPPNHATAPGRVSLIGMDGADLRVLETLLDRGVALPHFERMLAEGVSAPLETISPRSPVVWTSIATGVGPEQHGVHEYVSDYLRGTALAVPNTLGDPLGKLLNRFVHYRERRGVSANERRVKAMWEIFQQYGRAPLVVNWWASYPARGAAGVLVSDHVVPWDGITPASLGALAGVPGLVHPPERQEEVVALAEEVIARSGIEELSRSANRLDFELAEYFRARDEIVFGIYSALRRERFDLSAVYVQEIDASSHVYTTEVFGPNINRRRAKRVSRAENAKLWRELVVRAYERMDSRLADIMAGLGPDEALIVVSDHGWEYDGTSHHNQPDGILLALGSPFATGVRLRKAHVYDVLPTLALLLGIPVSDELPGRILTDALRPDFLEAHPPVRVAGYGRPDAVAADAPPALDAGHVDRLRALGYVE
jgi:hypothetical protein